MDFFPTKCARYSLIGKIICVQVFVCRRELYTVGVGWTLEIFMYSKDLTLYGVAADLHFLLIQILTVHS